VSGPRSTETTLLAASRRDDLTRPLALLPLRRHHQCSAAISPAGIGSSIALVFT
jgi:hypothetical protein